MLSEDSEKIKQEQQELCKLQETEKAYQVKEKIINLAKRAGAHIPYTPFQEEEKFVNETIRNIHIAWQTKTMLNACVSAEQSCKLAKQSSASAKWACIWAFLGVAGTWVSVLLIWYLRSQTARCFGH